MKIFVLPSWYPPHGGEFFADQAHALARHGHCVTVCVAQAITLRNPWQWLKALAGLFKGPRSTQDEHLCLYSIQYPTFPRWQLAKLELYVFFLRWCVERAVAARNAPDVMHVHSSIWAGVAAARIRRVHGYPYLITEHRSRFVNNPFVSQRDLSEMHSQPTRMALASANRVAAVSRSMLPALQHIGGVPPERLTVIPNMVDVRFFQYSEFRHKNTSPFCFFSLANLVPVKGYPDLIDAFARIVDQRSVELVIGGEGPARNLLEKQIGERNLSHCIRLLGQLDREQIRKQMGRADAFVLASRYEAFGVVFIEAMAMGLPLIGTRSGGPEEIITPELGFLVDVGDIGALAATMLQMIDERERFDSKRIARRAIEVYSQEMIAETLTRELAGIINKPSRNNGAKHRPRGS